MKVSNAMRVVILWNMHQVGCSTSEYEGMVLFDAIKFNDRTIQRFVVLLVTDTGFIYTVCKLDIFRFISLMLELSS